MFIQTLEVTLWHVIQLSGEDNNFFGLGGTRRVVPGKRLGDIMLRGTVATVWIMTSKTEGGLSVDKRIASYYFTEINIKDFLEFKLSESILQGTGEIFIKRDT